MDRHSKYRPLMDDIQDKICNSEIGVTGLYRLMLETLDEAEQELATLKASIPKIKADAASNYLEYLEYCKRISIDNPTEPLEYLAGLEKLEARE